MTILTFPWNDIGEAGDIDIIEICNTIRTPYTAGYSPSRPATTRIVKQFDVTWNRMRTFNWLYFVEFWRSVHGDADAFYFEFPIEMYDVGAFGGDDMGTEDPGGWDSEGDGMGFGAGPVFLVQFSSPKLPQKYRHHNYWRMTAGFLEI